MCLLVRRTIYLILYAPEAQSIDAVLRQPPLKISVQFVSCLPSEEQLYFRRRIRAYITLLKSGSYQEMFNSNAVTIAISTFQSTERIEQLRGWTRTELEGEPAALGDAFRFAALKTPLDPTRVWLGPVWLSCDDRPHEALLTT